MPADIAFRQRAVDCVAQRVDADIGIGVAVEPQFGRDGDAAQDHRPSGSQHMHVEAGAHAWHEGGGSVRSSRANILLIGEFDVLLGPATSATAQPGLFDQPGIVGGAGLGWARCSSSNVAKSEGLRRLGPVQPVARHGRCDDAPFATLERVGDRNGRYGAVMRCAAPRPSTPWCRSGMKGRAASCTSTISGAWREEPPAPRARCPAAWPRPPRPGGGRTLPVLRRCGASPTGCRSAP